MDSLLSTWKSRMIASIEALAQIGPDFSPSENFVAAPADDRLIQELRSVAGLKSPSPLAMLYASLDGLSLPDVHNGYFIHPVELVIRGVAGNEPCLLTGIYSRPILVFGSDGGGGRFALGSDGDGEIVYLGDGAVHGSTFDGEHGAVRPVSPDLDAFLWRLLADTEAFARGDLGWDFLGSAPA